MKPLMTGIYSHFTADPANALYTAVSGRMYHHEAPQGATFPYVITLAVFEDHDWTFEEEIEEVSVQFSIYTNERSASTAGTICGNLKSLYDDADLTVSGYSTVHMIRSNSQLLRDAANNIWQYIVEYDCFLRAN
jgi:hypothetical protein